MSLKHRDVRMGHQAPHKGASPANVMIVLTNDFSLGLASVGWVRSVWSSQSQRWSVLLCDCMAVLRAQGCHSPCRALDGIKHPLCPRAGICHWGPLCPELPPAQIMSKQGHLCGADKFLHPQAHFADLAPCSSHGGLTYSGYAPLMQMLISTSFSHQRWELYP